MRPSVRRSSSASTSGSSRSASAAGAEDGLPGGRVEFALGGAGRARVEGDQPVEAALRKKNATPTGIWSRSQARVVEAVAGVGEVAVRDRAEAARRRRPAVRTAARRAVQAQARARFSVSTRWRWSARRPPRAHSSHRSGRGRARGARNLRRPAERAPVGRRRGRASRAPRRCGRGGDLQQRGLRRAAVSVRRTAVTSGAKQASAASTACRAPAPVLGQPQPPDVGRARSAGRRCPRRSRPRPRACSADAVEGAGDAGVGVLGVQVVQDQQARDQFVAEQAPTGSAGGRRTAGARSGPGRRRRSPSGTRTSSSAAAAAAGSPAAASRSRTSSTRASGLLRVHRRRAGRSSALIRPVRSGRWARASSSRSCRRRRTCGRRRAGRGRSCARRA